MKNLLNILLLDNHLFRKPLQSKLGLFVLILAAGAVLTLRYYIRTGIFLNPTTLFYGVGFAAFIGIFSVLAFGWPVSDFLCSLDPEVEKFHLNIKRMKMIRGFIYAVILTGTIGGIVEYCLVRMTSFRVFHIASIVISILISLWAGGVITRCAFWVFEEAAKKKYLVFIISTVWFYVITDLVVSGIIRVVLSIGLR